MVTGVLNLLSPVIPGKPSNPDTTLYATAKSWLARTSVLLQPFSSSDSFHNFVLPSYYPHDLLSN
jgi:hypothetical protein